MDFPINVMIFSIDVRQPYCLHAATKEGPEKRRKDTRMENNRIE